MEELMLALKQCLDNQNALISTILQEKGKIIYQDERIQHETVHVVPLFQQFIADQDWESYILRLEQHFMAYKVETDDKKRAFFLSWVGSEIVTLLQKLFGCSDVGSKSYKDIIDHLNTYFASKVHVLASRYKLFKTEMKPGQWYSQWVAELKGVARSCNLNCTKPGCNQSLVDDYIRDVIVLHTPHDFV